MRYGWFVVGLLVTIGFLLLSRLFTSHTTCSLDGEQISSVSPEDARFLIILAEARSGSTWLGSFFKENENVLHFFEPLDDRVFQKVANLSATSHEEHTEMKLEVLSNECRCKFADVKYPAMGAIPSWSKSLHRLQGYLADDGSVIRQYRKPKGTDLAAKLKAKAPDDLGAVEDLCKKVELVSAKIIRLRDISVLARLNQLGCDNYKIMHLVRDPRPIIQSRMSTFGELHTGNGAQSSEFQENDIRDVSRNICSTYLRNLLVGRGPFFKDRYRVVKYEDIASDPVQYGRELYKYVGLSFTSQVEKHILDSSTGSVVQGKYEVVRNTAEVVDNWKKTMDPRHAKIVEDECQEMFKTFGYQNL